MTELGEGPELCLGGLIGSSVERLRRRLGRETTIRDVGGDRWLVYERPDVHLRVRVAPPTDPRHPAGDAGRVASWTATFRRNPPGSTEEAARRLGIQGLALAPPRPGAPLLRASLPDPATGSIHSLTARRRGGRLVQVTAFDEPPEWLVGDGDS